MKTLRNVLDEKGTAFGAWSVLPSPFATELLARGGYDWMCIDMQHGQIGAVESLMPLLQVMNRHDVPAFVRLPSKASFAQAMIALDYGAQGVVVPMVDTPEEAAAIAAALRYPPVGERSWAPVRAGLEIPGYDTSLANELVCCLIMIETASGLAHLDEILSVDGVDGAYVGPSDLAIAHGGPPIGNSSDKLLVELADRVVEGCRKAGKIAGIHSDGDEEALWWSDRGFQVVNVSVDAALVAAGSRAHLAGLAARLAERAAGGPTA
jgi:4-hydroxy-2-oxoheptanedioate aldolase